MLQDPFYVVRDEVQQSVNGITSLFTSWKELLANTNTSQSDDFKWTTNELKSIVRSVEWDLQDLEETISIVEKNRQKFRIDDHEIEERKRFVRETKLLIAEVKQALAGIESRKKLENEEREVLTSQSKSAKKPPGSKYERLKAAVEESNTEFISNEDQKMELIMKDQDPLLDQLGEGVGTLGQIAVAINSEVNVHNQMLTEVSEDVDKTQGTMKTGIKKMEQLLEATDNKKLWALIVVLILVLGGLIVIVSYV